jgi:hypothetical protein
MRRDQLEHAIRTACQIERPEVIVVGSQAIPGSFREDELPADAIRSVEVDILPIADSNDETARLADLIGGVAGEFSTFEELHAFQHRRRRSGNVGAPGSVARSVGESAERQHGGAGWTAAGSPVGAWTRKISVLPSSARSGRRIAARCSPVGGRTRRCGRDPRAASQRRGKTPARCRPCCGVVGVMERSGLTLGVLRRGSTLVLFEVPSPGISRTGLVGPRRTRWAARTARLLQRVPHLT